MYNILPPGCPDPERASHNIESFLSANPGYRHALRAYGEPIALLFSYSQFLANYATQHPKALFESLDGLGTAFTTERMRAELRGLFAACDSLANGMSVVRNFRKRNLLTITLKDILGRADPQQVMLDMSILADAAVAESLPFVEAFLRQRFGVPEDNGFVIVGLGKLGAQELNYSSDIDIICVYREEGETSGIVSHQGATLNRITAFEYYAKLTEEITRFLSLNTADGFAYRVDLRLRPQGQRGSLALPLKSYEEYYESWGQLWERAALLRARPVAGDMELGVQFLKTVQPFVYRKYLDFGAIDEIRRMKAQVEQLKSGTLSNDIKRGFGGIREIEFFVQVFQLMYGGKEPMLRDRGTLKSLHRLLQKGLIGYEDLYQLSGNYLFLRTLEHRLQQLNDVQTHSLPTTRKELDILGRKTGFPDGDSFMAELTKKRFKVRSIYDSLFQPRESGSAAQRAEDSGRGLLSSVFWDMQTPIEDLLAKELSKTAIRDIRKAIQLLTKIRNTIYSFQTIRGRRLLEDLIPRFVGDALRSNDPDLALLQLVDFFVMLAARESYLEALTERPQIISGLSFVFSHSEYLSKILMSNPYYIESFVEDEMREKGVRLSLTALSLLAERYGESTAVRLVKRLHEVRLGVKFLNRKIRIASLMKTLSEVAEAVLSMVLRGHSQEIPREPDPAGSSSPQSTLTVIAFGKLGGREITFNSDLDITFLTKEDPSQDEIRASERLLKLLTSYTKDGIAYQVDTRLRPEGTKGPLVNSLKGLRNYYSENAQPWELQALLKARPVNADPKTARSFMQMRREALTKREQDVSAPDMRRMREKIQREVSKDSPASGVYDIKLGPGGLEELEFAVQFLQLGHCRDNPQVLVQNTLSAVRGLHKHGILNGADAEVLCASYEFYRTIETYLRLRSETTLNKDTEALRSSAHFMGMDQEGLLHVLDERRAWVRAFWERLTG